MTRARSAHPVDLDAIEHAITDITSTLHRSVIDSRQQLPQVALQPTPDIGRLSADAVLEQYKMAAKSIEAMGEEIQERIRALEAAMRDCHDDMQLLQEAADAVRAKGETAHTEIARTAAVSKDIREIVAAIKAKLTP